ncbi:MAG TPA: hypothetical protein VGB63_17270 [Pedobacter sp.]
MKRIFYLDWKGLTKYMQRVVFLIGLLMLFATNTHAQQRVLTGYLKDSLTQLPIPDGTISNNTKNQKVRTDPNGFFRLLVSPNDLIYVVGPHYRYDTLRYSFLFQDTISILLSPVEILETVNIATGYRKYQFDSLQRRAAFEEMSGSKVNAVDRSSNKKYFGLTINLDKLFKTKDRKQGKQERFFEQQEILAYVRLRFSPQYVAYYTGLKGAELLTFMRLYTPSYEWLRAHTEHELVIDYLSAKLKMFQTASH